MRGNSSRIPDIIVALAYIGIVGFALDRLVSALGTLGRARHICELRIKAMASLKRNFLKIDHVDKSFSQRGMSSEVLKDINLTVDEGEFVAIIGHSGCGKSTLLNLVAGLTKVSSGVILLEEQEVNMPGPDRAVVFQNHSLLPWLTVYDNVNLAVDKVFGGTKSKRGAPRMDAA